MPAWKDKNWKVVRVCYSLPTIKVDRVELRRDNCTFYCYVPREATPEAITEYADYAWELEFQELHDRHLKSLSQYVPQQ